MAEIVETAVSFAVERIGDLLIQKAVLLEGVHDQVDRLNAELTRMQCLLKVASARQHEHERVRYWVSEIRHLAYQAEDAIDLYISNVAKPGKTKLFPWRIFQKQWNCNKTGKQIEGIQMKLQDIRRSLETYGINNSIGEATTSASHMLRQLRYSSPIIVEHTVVGLEEETDELVEQLVGGDERRRVVSIVGKGGTGKTTLAQKVYNDRRVLDRFPSYRAWVNISALSRPIEVFYGILYQLDQEKARRIENFDQNELGDFLHGYLRGKRFLVVLDDIWKCEDWKCVARAFPEDSRYSRLLLTTQNRLMALLADDRGALHDMRVLSDQESWELFCRHAFGQKEDGDTQTCPPGLEEMGEQMVEKCGGLPWAIIGLGGLLSCKPRSPAVWKSVLNNLQSHFADDGMEVLLSPGYLDLPHNLKSCFLYMGVFPEDQVIPKRRLLQLWMAEGFVAQHEEEGWSRERRAEEYLNELINRNLVQAVKVSVNERVTKCRIHDLARDLCIRRAQELNIFKMGPTSSPTSSRRLGVYHGDMSSWYASREASITHIRSLLFFTMKQRNFDFSESHLKLLRVLDLGVVCLKTKTIGLGELIHLRYLRLILETNINSLHPRRWGIWRSIHLYLPTSLQTLTLESSSNFGLNYPESVGRAVQKMENLHHLSLFRRIAREEHEPLQIERLRNLQTLFWISSKDWLQNNTSELTSLRKLKLQVNTREEEADQLSNSIAKCENLESLYLSGRSFYDISEIPCLVMNSWLRLTKLEMQGHIRKLPEAHEFPPSLTQLTLEDTGLGNESMVILEKLPKLLTLRLRANAMREDAQVLKDGFPQLRNLLLSHCRSRLDIDKGVMPKLTRLKIYDSPLIRGLGELIHLRKVDIDYKAMIFNGYEMPELPSPSQWHEIRSKNEEGEIICSFLLK